MQKLSLLDLDILVSVGKYKSLREFARERDVLPSFISKTLTRVERELGVKIFKRSVQGLSLTPDGVKLRDTAEKILEISKTLTLKSSNQKGQPKKKIITVASSSFLNSYVFPKCVPSLTHEFPNLKFRVIEMSHLQIQDEALRGGIDLALHLRPVTLPRIWSSQNIGILRSAIFAKTGHPLLPVCEPNDLKKYPFIVPVYLTKNGYAYGEDFCPLPLSERKEAHEASTSDIAINLVEQLNVLAYLPTVVAKNLVALGKVKEIKIPAWAKEGDAIYLSVNESEISQKFIEILLREIKHILKQA